MRTHHDSICPTYAQRIRDIPNLSCDEEFLLAKEWREKQNQDALNRLVNSHLKLVIAIAHGYKGYGLPIEDLIAEGQVGIMQATKHFDPERGFKFSTYAQWWIRSLIQEYILHSWSLVKIGTTNAQKKLFFSLRKTKNMIDARDGDSYLSDKKILEIAEHLNVSPTEVVQMSQRMMGHDSSLNAPLSQSDGESEWIEWVSDTQQNQEEKVLEENEQTKQQEILNAALVQLSERERRIFMDRRLLEKPKTLEELSQEFSISKERVRQIEAETFEKIKKTIKKICLSTGIHF
ncbi:MAG: RNA polymerase sigma factor RpoH [Holosporales bacterium]